MKALVVISLGLLATLSSASIRSDIEGQYKRWATAAKTNDVDTILSILTPSYTLRTYTGKVISYADYRASLEKRKRTNQPSDAYETSIHALTITVSSAEVISDETSSKESQDPVTGKKLRIIHIHRYRDLWLKAGATWRLNSTETQQESTKVVPL